MYFSYGTENKESAEKERMPAFHHPKINKHNEMNMQ